MVFLRWAGVFRLKHHLKPKKAEIIGVVFRLGSVLKTPPGPNTDNIHTVVLQQSRNNEEISMKIADASTIYYEN